MLRIAIIEDQFFRADLVTQALQRHLPANVEHTVRTMELDWPDEPPVHDADIQEYVGDPDAIARFVDNAHAVITQVAPVSRRLIENAPDLEVIGCARGGPVSVDIPAATARRIPVVHAPGANARAVAEFTLGLILSECKGIARAHCALTRGKWRPTIYHYQTSARELHQQTIGLVGFGHIGQLLVPHLRAFQMRTLIYDPYMPDERCTVLGVEKTDLSTLLHESDIVSLHARVTPQTRGMIGPDQFAQMKPGAYFINTARGPLVDYDALYKALASGHLGGAALDTFAVEPPPGDWPLLKLPNVTLTPHVAGASRETAWRKAEIVVIDIANFYAGRPLRHCANPEADRGLSGSSDGPG